MALIRTCIKCGKRNDSQPFNQHGWIDYTCYRCGGNGPPRSISLPYIPKDFRFKYLANRKVIPYNVFFLKLQQSIRRVA